MNSSELLLVSFLAIAEISTKVSVFLAKSENNFNVCFFHGRNADF